MKAAVRRMHTTFVERAQYLTGGKEVRWSFEY